jgi:hypothetical protein
MEGKRQRVETAERYIGEGGGKEKEEIRKRKRKPGAQKKTRSAKENRSAKA